MEATTRVPNKNPGAGDTASSSTGPRTLPAKTGGLLRSLAGRLTLVQRFALVSLVILVTGAFIIGSYVAREIESRVIARTSAITALYVESFIGPRLQEMGGGSVSPEKRAELDHLLSGTALGDEIVSFKIWDLDGTIVYARDPALIGQQFEVGGGLSSALSGEIHSHISSLEKEEHWLERQDWNRLLEIYAPVRQDETGIVLGVMEFYQDPQELVSEIGSSQQRGWLIVGISTAGMYLLLVGLVKGASNRLFAQHRELRGLAEANARLARRLREAAARKTETDERILMRVAHELHDGPAQDLGLGLLRIRSLEQASQAQVPEGSGEAEALRQDFALVESALADALREVREISAGLRLPELAELGLRETIEKAKHDYEKKTGSPVDLAMSKISGDGGLPLKITVYRVLQEALINSFRHAGAAEQAIRASAGDGRLLLEVLDGGPGLPPETEDDGWEHGLGLRGMRERVEMLGGTLTVANRPEGGTRVEARFPLDDTEVRSDG
jgi:signal transduction histidine kinase